MNTFGEIYRLTTFGESHGPAIGGIIDGMPAGVAIDTERLQKALDRRRPGQSDLSTPRREADVVNLLSGIFEGRTTGTPIGFTIENTNTRSADYDEMRHTFRPSHADYTYSQKYGVRDHRGGGRSSARETASRIVGGELAMQALASKAISITAYTSQIGTIALDTPYTDLDLALTESNPVRCPDRAKAEAMERLIRNARSEGDTLGGTVTCIIKGCPAGLGEPVFDKLQSRLAAAMMSINAVKGFEYGMGFEGASRKGSEMADSFTADKDGHVRTLTNHSGGIQGGISNGEDIYFKVAFKPVATIFRPLATVTDTFENTELLARGRHDPCVVPRAVPIVEAMAAMVILDAMLLNQTTHLK